MPLGQGLTRDLDQTEALILDLTRALVLIVNQTQDLILVPGVTVVRISHQNRDPRLVQILDQGADNI